MLPKTVFKTAAFNRSAISPIPPVLGKLYFFGVGYTRADAASASVVRTGIEPVELVFVD